MATESKQIDGVVDDPENGGEIRPLSNSRISCTFVHFP